jgi:hypothetical protein
MMELQEPLAPENTYIMELTKRQKLEAAGWKVGTVADFLQLSPEEIEMIEIRWFSTRAAIPNSGSVAL